MISALREGARFLKNVFIFHIASCFVPVNQRNCEYKSESWHLCRKLVSPKLKERMARMKNTTTHPFYLLQVTANQSSDRGRALPVSELVDAPQTNHRCAVPQFEGDSLSTPDRELWRSFN